MAARKVEIRHDAETRAKIQAAQIIDRMQACVMGEVVLDSQQVSCAKALLNKVLPDLQSASLDAAHVHETGDTLTAVMRAINGKTRSI